MITMRRADQRGYTKLRWLDSRHTFSFNEYRDSEYSHFRKLRVINEDWIDPGQGFAAHPHRDMEILTWVLEGALEHRDSLGNGSIIRPGDLQRMTAGTGILHSEFNHSKTAPVHLLQIWIFPDQKALTPEYEQKSFENGSLVDKFKLIAAGDGRNGAVALNQDVSFHIAKLSEGKLLRRGVDPNRHTWLQLAAGSITLNGNRMEIGDGAAVYEESVVEVEVIEKAELLLIDLA